MIHTANGERIEDDRDHICNKRIEMVGDLMANLINSLFKRSIKTIQQFNDGNIFWYSYKLVVISGGGSKTWSF